MTKSRSPRSTAWRGQKPWSTDIVRVCAGERCTTVLSRYNKYTLCAKCDALIPPADKPYRHQF